ncbi:MAG: sulfite exporter TauE/SafE family protein [Rhodomicrobium sp.]
MEQLAALMALGAISGLFSGLLGIGGGIIIVPAMTLMMPHFGMAGPDLVRIAIATAMATTVVATFSGVQTHLSRGAVDWTVIGRLAPGIMAGAFAGPLLSEIASSKLLAALFVGFLFWGARSMAAGRAQHEAAKPLPGILPSTIKGLGIGALCAVLGIGAAPITVPLLCAYLPIQRSIGTSAALGVPLAVTAAAGYFLGETPAATCPEGCTGYVYLAGAAAIAIAMIFTVPVGAYLTHVLPGTPLRLMFAACMVAMALQMGLKTLPAVDLKAYAAGLRPWLKAPDSDPQPAQPFWLGEANAAARQARAER